MSRRYALPEEAWELIADLFSRPARTGRPRRDDRLMLNGLWWVLCSGALRVPDLLPPCAADQIQRNWLLGFITAWLETLPEAEPVENGLPLYALLGGTLWRDRPLLLELLPIALELMKDPS
ncbi:MAG: transposase, partial [Sphingobacteriia bacterium]|nr:transposase [Sphingobacteriia bacterium]NCC41571.1 transposase [Gammaproteobacteria bacterium]